MNTEVFKNIIAEWLEEWKLPSMIRRETPTIDLKNLSDILAIVGPRRAGKTYYMYELIGDYLKEGGFPEVVKRDIVREKRELLQSYYRTLFYRDLIERYSISATCRAAKKRSPITFNISGMPFL